MFRIVSLSCAGLALPYGCLRECRSGQCRRLLQDGRCGQKGCVARTGCGGSDCQNPSSPARLAAFPKVGVMR